MAASQSEADQLRRQIAFLTNLINSARNPGSNIASVPRLRQPHPSPGSLGFGNVRGHFGQQQQRFPHRTYLNVNNRQPTPSRVSVDASNVRFPLSSSGNNQANMAGGPALYNRLSNPQATGNVYKPNVPSQPNRTVYMPNTPKPATSGGSSFTAPNNVSNMLGSAVVRQQNPVQVFQGPNLQQSVASQDSRVGANFMHMSLHNADVCVQTTRSAGTSSPNINTTPTIPSIQNRFPSSVPQSTSATAQGLLGAGVVQNPTGLGTQGSSSQAEEPRMQQMAVLMEELQKTQSKILDLQKQLLDSTQKSQQPQHQQSQQTQQQQVALLQAQNPVQSAAHVPGLMGVRLPGNPQAGIPGVMNVSAAHGQPLAQSNKVWLRNSAPSAVGNMSNQQVVGRPVRVSGVWSGFPPSRHPTSLTGPRLIKPLHARHHAPVVLNTRFQLKRLQSQVMANCIQQSVRAVQARNIQESVRAAQIRNMQQSVRAAQFQQSVRAAQVRNMQQSMRAAQVQQMMNAAHTQSVHETVTATRVNNSTGETSIQSISTERSPGGTQMIMSKYKFQRSGLVAAQAIVSKYKLQKVSVFGNRMSQMTHFRGRYFRQPRSHVHYPFSSRFPSRFYSPTQTHQNMWHSTRGGHATHRNWKARYQQQTSPWMTRRTYARPHRGRFPTHRTSSRVFKKRQWLSWKHRAEMSVKRLLQKRLQLLHKALPPPKTKLKLDRRRKKALTRPRGRSQPRSTSTRLVLINGLLYKSSSKSLTKANVQSSPSGPSVSGVRGPINVYSSRKTSVVVRKMNSAAMKTIKVRGVKFRMDSSGRSLQRIDQSASPSKSSGEVLAKAQVKRVDIGGVTYIQTKPGTLVRSGSNRTRALASRVKSRSIAAATQSLRKDNTKSVNGYCVFYNKFGRCKLGTQCPYLHDPNKVAVCTRFLRGTCKVDNCPFSHKVSKEKMPVCSFFLRGLCSRDNCPYLHVKVNRDAAVCQDFVRGFCPRGEQCQKKHTLRCPSFAKSGLCPRGKNCPMLHKRSARRPVRSSRSGCGNKELDVPCDTAEASVSTKITSDKNSSDGVISCNTGSEENETKKETESDMTAGISSQTDLGEWKAMDPDTIVPSPRDVPGSDRLDSAVSESTQSLLESEEAAGTEVSTSGTTSTPDKLPSYISLADVIPKTEEETGTKLTADESSTEGVQQYVHDNADAIREGIIVLNVDF